MLLSQMNQGATLLGLANEVAARGATISRGQGVRQDRFKGNAIDQDGVGKGDLIGIKQRFPEEYLHPHGRAFSSHPFHRPAKLKAGSTAPLAGRTRHIQMPPFNDDGCDCIPLIWRSP